jgi:hypothetical protein
MVETVTNTEVNSMLNPEKVTSDKIIQALQINNIPEEIIISTMTIVCKTEALFYAKNIGYYIDLIKDKICSVSYGTDKESNRAIEHKKKKRNVRNKKTKLNFYNQVSIEALSDNGSKVNIKLFSNGSIQMTGCKNIENSFNALNNLFGELKKTKAIYDPKQKKIIEKPFVDNISKLSLEKIDKIKIAMINSNFNIGFKIDRDKLYDLLQSKGYTECTYDPIIHACVNIKYDSDGKAVSIFVFESGSIIITGANNGKHILEAYNFINKLLCTNYKIIYKSDVLSNSEILMYLS